MTYDWETKITQDMLDKIDAILPRNISLMGIAVANVRSVEAALIRDTKHSQGEMADRDQWQDVLGDADRIHANVVEVYGARFCKPRAADVSTGSNAQ